MAMLEDVLVYIDANTAFTAGTDLFKNQLPETVSTDAVVIYQYEGEIPEETFGANVADMPRLQLVTRSATLATAYANHDTVRTLLRAVTNTTLNGNRFLRIAPLGSPFVMDRDEQDRWKVVSNYRVWR